MSEFVPIQERLRRRIACELRLMGERARTAGDGACFWILSNRGPADVVLETETGLRRPKVRAESDAAVRQGGRFRKSVALPPERWETGTDDGPDPLVPSRFVQVLVFAAKPYFLLDLPNATIDVHETEILLRDRLGFVPARERPALGYAGATVEAFDPVCKQYLVDDEDRAAEDIAWVLFELWGLAPDAPLYLSAARAEGCNCWFERDVPLDDLECPRPVGTVGCPRCLGLVAAGGGE